MTLRKTLLAAALPIAMLLAGTSSAMAEMTLRMSHQWTENNAGSKVDKWFAEEIEKRTNGEVKIKIFWAEALGKAKENLTLLQQGAVDMAAMSPGYFPAQMPFYAAPNSIPMTMDEVPHATELMKRLMTEVPIYQEETKRNGIKALFFHHLNPYKLVCKDAVTSVDGMKGKKMRTWGKDMPRMVQAAGGTPVTLSLPEIYEGLSRGAVDCAPFAVDLVVNYKIYEVAKNISNITLWLGPSTGIWISQSAWAKLTPEQQEIFVKTGLEAAERDREAVVAAGAAAIATLEAKGVTMHDFPAAEAAKWRAANPDFFADFIAEMEKKGWGDDARKTVAIWKEVTGR
ncbi:MAG: TRAP transporter substrate-binding protein DctP [Anderseniella sp.]